MNSPARAHVQWPGPRCGNRQATAQPLKSRTENLHQAASRPEARQAARDMATYAEGRWRRPGPAVVRVDRIPAGHRGGCSGTAIRRTATRGGMG